MTPPITNYFGRTGAGKSTKTKLGVITKPGRHLYIVPLKKLVYEVEEDLRKLRVKHDLGRFSIHAFESDQSRKGGGVTKRIRDRIEDYPDDTHHTCFVTTQAAFLLLDLETFRGWHLHLDELLTNGVMSGVLYSPAAWPALDALFTLEPVVDDDGNVSLTTSRILRRDDVDPRDVAADPRVLDADKDLFVRCGTPTPVLVEASSIEDFARRRCHWYSAWTLADTSPFASVEIAACDLEESLMYQLAPPFEYTSIWCPSAPSAAEIKIKFFDAGPLTCSANFWTTPSGKRNLIACALYISKTGVDYWTCNDSAIDLLKPLMPKTSSRRLDELNDIDGTFIPQRQEGTNEYRDCTSCAMFLSAKAQDHEEVFERHWPGVSRAVISQAREGSLLWQFAGRGAPRCIGFDEVFTIHVYDKQQAEALRDKYRSNGYPSVSIEHVALPGFVNRVHERSGPRPLTMTVEERLEHDRALGTARQQAWRNRKKASSGDK